MPAKTAQQRYDEAVEALHALQTGTQARVVVDGQDGSRVEYSPTTVAALKDYISSLATMLPGAFNPAVYAPARFIF